ncbi:hypothetical protein [Mariniflexile sp.]|uniref:hypothetical protein n=1 Tax=Mariniflexile sp. TaxID=1979402 RepID=UPI00356B250A
MEEKKYYTCDYCYTEFAPKRRRVQKFCSNTCRSKAHHAKKNSIKQLTETTKEVSVFKVPDVPPIPIKNKVEAMSVAGMGNATAGTLIADGIKAVFTSAENKPATKGDLKNLTEKLVKRYHPIKNMQRQPNGALPYYDIETGNVVYSLIAL